jgi:hypothetical protein
MFPWAPVEKGREAIVLPEVNALTTNSNGEEFN